MEHAQNPAVEIRGDAGGAVGEHEWKPEES